MADESDEEVRRVLDAIDSLGQEGDAADRARRLTELLDGWPDQHAKVRAMRQQAVREMHDSGMSLRKIGSALNISFSRVRQILEGVTTSPTNKAAKGQPNGAAVSAGPDDPSGSSEQGE